MLPTADAVGAAAGFTLVLGLTMFMHEYSYSVYILAAGVFMVLATMFFWWRDVVREAEYQGHHTPIVQIGHRYGMTLFIASEVMFFVAWFWAIKIVLYDVMAKCEIRRCWESTKTLLGAF